MPRSVRVCCGEWELEDCGTPVIERLPDLGGICSECLLSLHRIFQFLDLNFRMLLCSDRDND
jgi:hypothetical protein